MNTNVLRLSRFVAGAVLCGLLVLSLQTLAADVDYHVLYQKADTSQAAADKIETGAKAGNAKAQFYRGLMYAHGSGVSQDDTKAAKWARKAAEQGDAEAQCNLGAMYDAGQGVPQDEIKAVKWYRNAAAQGFAMAQSNLGAMYALGRGVPKNDAKALKWYRQAAVQRNAVAQFNLGVMYEFGQGVAQDDVTALKWFLVAKANGVEKATRGVQIIKKSMMHDAIEKAQKAATKWRHERH